MTTATNKNTISFVHVGGERARVDEEKLAGLIMSDLGGLYSSSDLAGDILHCETGLDPFPENVAGHVCLDIGLLCRIGIVVIPGGLEVNAINDDGGDENCLGGIVLCLGSGGTSLEMTSGWSDVDNYLPMRADIYEAAGIDEPSSVLDDSPLKDIDEDAAERIARLAVKHLAEKVVLDVNHLLDSCSPALSGSEAHELHENINAAIEVLRDGVGANLPELTRALQLATKLVPGLDSDSDA